MCSKISILILALIMTTVGCGEKKRASHGSGSRTFVTENKDLLEKQEFERALTPEAKIEYEANKAAPLITKGFVKSEMKPYEMPQKFFERLEKTDPKLAVRSSLKFKISEPFLDIKAKDKKMTFTGILKVEGRQDERIELSCAFDAAQVPWVCGEMYPTNAKVAEERRMQATATCLDTFKCEETGVEIFVVINGKTESQLFQTKNFSARKAVSGDIEEEMPEIQPVGPQEATPPVKPIPGKPTRGRENEPPVQPVKPRDYQPQVEDPNKPKVYEKPVPPAPRSDVPANQNPAQETQQQQKQPSPQQAQPAAPQAQPAPTQMSEDFGPDLSEQELEEIMEDPNQAIEFSAPLPMPQPSKGKYSIPGIETLRPDMGGDVRPQAVGAHNRGILKTGATLEDSTGMMCRQRANRNFGTDMTIELLTDAAKSVDNGQSKIVIANISKQGGGRLCNPSGSCHASHQTGLDVDIVFPSTRNVSDMWSLCGPNQARCGGGSHISDDFDAKRFWKFTKTLTCAKGRPVIAMFVDQQIKRHMCNWVRQNTNEDLSDSESCAFRTLQAMKHATGHHNHVHVRFKCPGNRECRDATVSLGRGTGC